MPGGFSYLGDFKVTDSGGEIVSSSVSNISLKSSAVDDSSIELDGNNKISIKDSGVGRDHMSPQAGKWVKGALAVSGSAAGVFQVTNSTGSDLMILRVIIYLTTVCSVGGVTIDVGTGSGASTSYDNLIDGLDIVTATGVFDNFENTGTNGKHIKIWENGEYINASASATNTATVGYYAINYVNVTDA